MSSEPKIALLDTTLREGEQTPGVAFTVEQRTDIALKLSEAGIGMIEVGHPVVSPDVSEGIKRIVRLKSEGVIRSEIVGHSRAMKSDVETVASLGVDRIAIFYGVSDLHLASKTHNTREQALSTIVEAISYAKSLGVKVRFTPEDASRTDRGYLAEVTRQARDAGADRISIADTVGILWPPQAKKLVEDLRRDVPGVEFDIHAHNDLGNAVANSLSAIEGGASVVHSTMNGLGERVGITPTQVIAVALKYHLGVDVANLPALLETSRLVELYSGIRMPPNFPITGEFAFVHKSGVHVAGIINNPGTYEFLEPSILGRSRDYVIDKYTGKHALSNKMKSLGIELSEDHLHDMIKRIKDNSSVGNFSNSELLNMAKLVQETDTQIHKGPY